MIQRTLLNRLPFMISNCLDLSIQQKYAEMPCFFAQPFVPTKHGQLTHTLDNEIHRLLILNYIPQPGENDQTIQSNCNVP